MVPKTEKTKNRTYSKLDLSSKFWKVLLTVLAAFLIFAGPTFMVYFFIEVLSIGDFISKISGFFIFLVGLFLVWHLVRQKVIS